MHVCAECGRTYGGPGLCAHDGAELIAAADDPLIGQTVGSWRIVRLIGAGGMGRVYKAVQPAIGGRVAVKVLSRECAEDRDLVDRFFSEARAVNVIRHESIVNVLDLSVLPDGRPYIVMEYIEGAPLSAVIAARGRLPLGGLARLVGEVLGALGATHQKGIVHRDLKPDNIFVTPGGRAKVLDFGVAKLAPGLDGRSGKTRTGSILGTPYYMSPEQAAGLEVDWRTDLYAMGVILFEASTGALPFSATSLFHVLRMHIEEPPPPPRAARPDMPPAFEAVILRALDKDPARRFGSAHEMAQALAAAGQALPPESWSMITPVHGGPSADSLLPTAPLPSPQPMAWPSAAPTPPHAASAPTPAGPSPTRDRRGRAMALTAGALAVVAAASVAIVMATRGRGGDDGGGGAGGAGDGDGETAAGEGAREPRASRRFAAADRAPDAGATAPDRAGPDSGREAGVKPAPLLYPVATATAPDAGLPAAPAPAASPAPRRTRTSATPPTPPAAPSTSTTPVSPGAVNHPNAPRYVNDHPNLKSWDVLGWLPKARKLAREILPDAELTYIYATYVRPDGRADLTIGRNGMITYMFRSPKASIRGDTPAGVELRCKVIITAYPSMGVMVTPLGDHRCNEPIVGTPRCSVPDLWKRALERGAPDNGVASLMLNRAQGGAQWVFMVGEFTQMFEDDCP